MVPSLHAGMQAGYFRTVRKGYAGRFDQLTWGYKRTNSTGIASRSFFTGGFKWINYLTIHK